MKKLLLAAFIIAAISVYGQDSSYVRPSNSTIFTVVQQMPKFQGDVYQWIADHLQYPKQAINKNIQGSVFVTFVIEKDGSVSGVKVIKSVGPLLDTAAVQCVRSMPAWTPGMQNGSAVRVQYNIPIHFELRDSKPAPVATVPANASPSSVKITVFQPNQPQDVSRSRAHIDSMSKENTQCIKWNWSLLTRGVFLINYEFYLTGNLTAEIGAGLTYRDYVYELSKGLDNYNAWNSTAVSYDEEGPPKINICGEGGLRYYMRGYDNMGGVYVEGMLSYRKYSFSHAPELSEGFTMVPGYQFTDVQLKFGYQVDNSDADIVTDFYMGVGIRSGSVNYYTTQPAQINYGTYNVEVPQTRSVSFPQFLFGFKMVFPL